VREGEGRVRVTARDDCREGELRGAQRGWVGVVRRRHQGFFKGRMSAGGG